MATRGAPGVAVVGGHQRVAGSILLPGAVSGNASAMEFRFHGMRGGLPHYTSIKTVRFRPVTEAETERGMRDRQVTVSVRALGGAYWMDPGEPAIQRASAGVGMAGLGVRVTKGISSLLGFEVDLSCGRSGRVTFADVQWPGSTGTVSRQAAFGRALGVGIIRFGDRYVGSMRAGFGIQLANYDSTFDVGGNAMDGPGDGLEVDGLLVIGAGFDARLGDHWKLGTGSLSAQRSRKM